MISPCTGVCVLDWTSSLCTGCSRTTEEIASWLSMTEVERRQTLERVALRRAESAAAMSENHGAKDQGQKD